MAIFELIMAGKLQSVKKINRVVCAGSKKFYDLKCCFLSSTSTFDFII